MLLAVPLAAQLAMAQSSPPIRKAPPPPPPPPATDQEQFVSYWTAETGWMSELQLRNNAVNQDVTVTPVLRLSNGTETRLTPVTAKPQEVKAIDLDAAIAAAAAPQLVGVYGSVVLRYRSPSTPSLYAAMMIRKTGHAVAFHIDATGEDQTQDVGSREGIWWLPNGTANDYLILTNQSQNPLELNLSLFDASGKASTQVLALASRAMSRFSVRQLVQAAGLSGSYGGLKIAASANAGSLDTVHFLYDETAGFSAILKMFNYDPRAKLEERDYARTSIWTVRAPMLALSNPDPALAFPLGTKLQPQLFLRNTTAKIINAALRFNWRTATGATGKAQGPALRLNPYETRRIDVSALQDGKTLPAVANWASVTITTDSKPDELVAVAASYDATLRYGAQTPFSDQLTFRWEGGMWEFDPYHNSIITAGNGGTKPTKTAFTIFYNQGTQRYDLEQTLQPDEQMWIDVGKLIGEHVPDRNGKTLPADLTSGSYEFRDLTNIGVGTLFEGKIIYDKTYGHVAYGCGTCCGYYYPKLFFNPLLVLAGSTAPDGVTAYDQCTRTYDDVSGAFDFNWGSADTAIVTVDDYGTHTGVLPGSTTSGTSGTLEHYGHTLCPDWQVNPGGGANVQKPGFLEVVSNSPDTSVCLGLSCAAILKYKVLDTNKQAMNIAGMTIAESVSSISGSCPTSSVTDSSTWTTDSTGTMIGTDELFVCCNGATCGISWNQTFTVNGFGVIILSQDGVTTGTKNVISVSCSGGNGSCPRIAITP